MARLLCRAAREDRERVIVFAPFLLRSSRSGNIEFRPFFSRVTRAAVSYVVAT